MSTTIRVGAIQTKNRTVRYTEPFDAALDRVRANLGTLVDLAERAKNLGCDIVGYPEDTLGTLEWTAGNQGEAGEFLRLAEREMLTCLGDAAGRLGMSIICCNDSVEDAGDIYNTAILLGCGGEEIGRYRKVHPTLAEQSRKRGSSFPVFEVPGIGTVGLCICYDMLFPETTRALALAGADLVYDLTLGGASKGVGDMNRATFRARAADNFIYLVVVFRGGGSMIVSPKGEVLAEGGGEDDILVADIDPRSGRDAGDALGGITTDYRARLFRERNPEAYGILTDRDPPVFEKLKHVRVPDVAEASRLMHEGLTTGARAFKEAETLMAAGKVSEARSRFEALSEHFGTIWIGLAARRKLQEIGGTRSGTSEV